MDWMNFCPGNPGSTVITSIMSAYSRTSSRTYNGVVGLIAIPAFTPRDFILDIVL